MNKTESVWTAVVAFIGALALIAIVYTINNQPVEEVALVQVERIQNTDATSSTDTSTTTETSSTTDELPVVPALEVSYINLTIEEAQRLAESNQVPFRIIMQDGNPLPATLDYRPGRINASVEGGLVVEVSVE